MSKTIWVIQIEGKKQAWGGVITDHFWFFKPTLAQLVDYGFDMGKAKAFLKKGIHEGVIHTYYLREFKEGALV